MGLARLKDETAKNLPYGRQRALGMAIALTTEPTLLFLDEPVAGMNAVETLETADLIRKMRERGITILLVEHDMKMVMDLCDRVTVLNYGRKIADGKPEEVRKNKEVIEAYLGRGKYARVA
jgi:branched-chain amino acid transport system ATP-binding protein